MFTQDYSNRFGGIGRLYGQEALAHFHDAHVMIVGLGGVGSWAAESLARSGIGQLTLIDLDDLCITNTNRQLPAHDGNYGKMKAEALAERLRLITPECQITPVLSFYSERTAEALLSSQPDVVIDAIDAIKAKCHLLATCHRLGIPVFTSGGAGGKMDATRVQVADLSKVHGDKLASSVRQRLRKEYNFPSGAGKKPQKFRIPTVFSDEPMTAPQPCDLHEADSPTNQPAEEAPRNLNCATGYGAVTHLTATFGFTLAQLALTELSKTATG